MSDKIPRLDFEDLDLDLAKVLEPRVERLGYLGEFFKCTAHQPAALLSFFEFTENSKKGLPKTLGRIDRAQHFHKGRKRL